MHEIDGYDEEGFDALVKKIESRSKYKRLPPSKRKYMTVPEMGKLLGLKKTERYWLVHKNFFETQVIHGKMMVDLSSFEKWYANQIKYKKITGEEPGIELKQRSYSARDIAQMLQVCEATVYEEMKKANVEYILVDYWKRYPKEAFDEWYQNQGKYRNQEDREAIKDLMDATMSMPEMARLLGVSRSTVYSLLERSDVLQTIRVDGRKRVTKESFYEWYGNQNKYQIISDIDNNAVEKEADREIEAHRRAAIERDGNSRNVGTDKYLTIKEAAIIARVNPATITKWIKNGNCKAIRCGKGYRIPRAYFEAAVR